MEFIPLKEWWISQWREGRNVVRLGQCAINPNCNRRTDSRYHRMKYSKFTTMESGAETNRATTFDAKPGTFFTCFFVCDRCKHRYFESPPLILKDNILIRQDEYRRFQIIQIIYLIETPFGQLRAKIRNNFKGFQIKKDFTVMQYIIVT